jgi:hypothetical protein
VPSSQLAICKLEMSIPVKGKSYPLTRRLAVETKAITLITTLPVDFKNLAQP